MGARRQRVGGGVAARRQLRAVQRPPHPAVVRQPAGGRVPSDAGARRPARPHHPPRARPRPARGRRVQRRRCRRQARPRRRSPASGLSGAVKTSGAKGVHVFVPIDGDDQRPRRRRRHPGASRNGRRSSTRRSPPRRSSRTIAAARSSSMPPARAAPPWSPPTARVPAQTCRCRFRSVGTTSTRSRPATSRSTTPWRSSPGATRGRSRCRPIRPTAGPARRGSRDPDPAGGGDARRQTPQGEAAGSVIS